MIHNIHIHPLVAWSDHGPNAAAFAGPDPAQDRLEPDAMLILTPQFNPGFGIRLAKLVDLFGQFFKSRLLGFIALLVLWTRHTRASAQTLQVVPAATRINFSIQALLHPGCDFGTRPEAAIGRRPI